MIKLVRAAASIAAIAFTVAACSSGASGACESYVDALIDRGEACGFEDASQETLDEFVAACANIASAPGVTDFDGQVDACADQIASSGCSISGLSCRIKGSLADGEKCGTSAQCQGGQCATTSAMAVPDSEIRCGTCASYLPIGAACDAGGPACEPLVSHCSGSPGTCVAYAKVGEDCGAGCESTLTCDATTNECATRPTKGEACTSSCVDPYRCVGGACAEPVAEGQPCPTGNECASGLDCNSMSVCAQPKHAAEGQPCGFVEGEFVDCDEGFECEAPGADQAEVCVRRKVEGDACTVGKSECRSFLICTSGTCQLPDFSLCQ